MQAAERGVRREEGQGRILMRGLGLPGQGTEQVMGLCSATEGGGGGGVQNQRHRAGGYCVRVTIEGMAAKGWPSESSWCETCQWTERAPEAAGREPEGGREAVWVGLEQRAEGRPSVRAKGSRCRAGQSGATGSGAHGAMAAGLG